MKQTTVKLTDVEAKAQAFKYANKHNFLVLEQSTNPYTCFFLDPFYKNGVAVMAVHVKKNEHIIAKLRENINFSVTYTKGDGMVSLNENGALVYEK